MIEHIIQFMILTTSAVSIWLVSRDKEWRKWGFIIGLIGQPFYFYTSFVNEQWGMFLLTTFYSYVWIEGIYINFIKKK